jgi:hypothetical protein
MELTKEDNGYLRTIDVEMYGWINCLIEHQFDPEEELKEGNCLILKGFLRSYDQAHNEIASTKTEIYALGYVTRIEDDGEVRIETYVPTSALYGLQNRKGYRNTLDFLKTELIYVSANIGSTKIKDLSRMPRSPKVNDFYLGAKGDTPPDIIGTRFEPTSMGYVNEVNYTGGTVNPTKCYEIKQSTPSKVTFETKTVKTVANGGSTIKTTDGFCYNPYEHTSWEILLPQELAENIFEFVVAKTGIEAIPTLLVSDFADGNNMEIQNLIRIHNDNIRVAYRDQVAVLSKQKEIDDMHDDMIWQSLSPLLPCLILNRLRLSILVCQVNQVIQSYQTVRSLGRSHLRYSKFHLNLKRYFLLKFQCGIGSKK